ncbi:MAG: hypothetical protein ACE5FW_01940 [Candidatus Aenigmatarchaeota archaeon]
MDEEVFEISVDKERAKSLLRMVEVRLQSIKDTDKKKYASLVLEEYYDAISELLTAVLLLDGYKTLSHKALIEHIGR